MHARAKFYCYSETRLAGMKDAMAYKFNAVYDQSIPDNVRYAVATPVGTLEFTVTNPAVRFELGKSYYLDITEAEE